MSYRTTQLFSIDNPLRFKQQLLTWAKTYETVVWLDSNQHKDTYSVFDGALAVDEFTAIQTDSEHAFDKLKEYQSHTKDYLFGYLSYDLKNDTEKLTSANFDGLQFPALYFFQPKKLIFIKGNSVEFQYLKMEDAEIESDFKAICKSAITTANKPTVQQIKQRVQKEAYLAKIDTVLKHIHRGDIYEVNFCQEFYAADTSIDPLPTFQHLTEISEAPFSAFLKVDDHYALCASPERYLQKKGNTVSSQPIKGTAKRVSDPLKDAAIATALAKDEKERAENIMIVDLVRNDLSKTAKKGSVLVPELCEVHSFKQVHQLISTVQSTLAEDTHPVTVLKDTFPMGSMTGAPKVSAMQIIEQLEVSKRGLYAGAVGYFTPSGDFDFNVMIRSIFYNAATRYVSYTVGGAITAKSIPAKEYEECLLKAKAMQQVLLQTS